MKFTTVCNFFIVASTAFASNVIEVTDSTINEYLENGVPTMLDIYASWCSHCKRLAPVYDELSDLFDKNEVQFLKIDGDIHGKTSKKFNVQYFPTIKFLHDGNVEDVEVRGLDALSSYVTKMTGVVNNKDKPSKKSEPQVKIPKKSNVVSLLDTNFDNTIKGKNALVAFTASWCGHCKNLKSAYEDLANVYVNDEDVLIGLVDCTGEGTSELSKTFQISAYPSIFFFTADGGEPEPYNGGRSVEDFVKYFTNKQVSFRTAEGGLSSGAGRIEALDKLAAKIRTVSDIPEAVSQLKHEAEKITEPTSKHYIRIADKIVQNGVGYIQKEIDRLSGILSKKSVGQQKLDELQIKANILAVFNGQKSTDIVHGDL